MYLDQGKAMNTNTNHNCDHFIKIFKYLNICAHHCAVPYQRNMDLNWAAALVINQLDVSVFVSPKRTRKHWP